MVSARFRLVSGQPYGHASILNLQTTQNYVM
jgi:hypothetical protein